MNTLNTPKSVLRHLGLGPIRDSIFAAPSSPRFPALFCGVHYSKVHLGGEHFCSPFLQLGPRFKGPRFNRSPIFLAAVTNILSIGIHKPNWLPPIRDPPSFYTLSRLYPASLTNDLQKRKRWFTRVRLFPALCAKLLSDPLTKIKREHTNIILHHTRFAPCSTYCVNTGRGDTQTVVSVLCSICFEVKAGQSRRATPPLFGPHSQRC